MDNIVRNSLSFKENAGVANDLYHGTSTAIAQEIVKTGFKAGPPDTSYLGFGVYFFQSNLKLAKTWATIKALQDQSGPCVLVATADLGNVWLINPYAERLIRDLIHKSETEKKRPLMEGQAIELLVSQILPRIGINVDTVKKIIERDDMNINVCIRNPEKIMEKSILEETYEK